MQNWRLTPKKLYFCHFLGPNDHFLRSTRRWTQKIVPPSTGYGPKLLIYEIKVTVNRAKSTVNAPKTAFWTIKCNFLWWIRWRPKKIFSSKVAYESISNIYEIKVTVNGAKSTVNGAKTVFFSKKTISNILFYYKNTVFAPLTVDFAPLTVTFIS